MDENRGVERALLSLRLHPLPRLRECRSPPDGTSRRSSGDVWFGAGRATLQSGRRYEFHVADKSLVHIVQTIIRISAYFPLRHTDAIFQEEERRVPSRADASTATGAGARDLMGSYPRCSAFSPAKHGHLCENDPPAHPEPRLGHGAGSRRSRLRKPVLSECPDDPPRISGHGSAPERGPGFKA